MIRADTEEGWLLITHPDHAKLAGDFALAWGNATFPRPARFDDVFYAVAHHDDGWKTRDAAPWLTKEGKPEAFTRTLVGTYAAFEEIDVPSYLKVRENATQAVASENAYAGILVSMHTVNLLTEQADVSSVRPEHRDTFHQFIASQREWQCVTAGRLQAEEGELKRGFEFLQCCDNLSLIACSGYDQARALRHTHPDTSGQRHALHCTPIAAGEWQIDPWPFHERTLTFQVPTRRVAKAAARDTETFRQAFREAPIVVRDITLRAK